MLKHNEKLLELLTEARQLALEQQAKIGTRNLDVIQITGAIEVVGMRIRYLKANPETSAITPAISPKRGGSVGQAKEEPKAGETNA